MYVCMYVYIINKYCTVLYLLYSILYLHKYYTSTILYILINNKLSTTLYLVHYHPISIQICTYLYN